MKEIWKHYFEETDTTILNLVPGAKILSIQIQNNRLCLWEQHDAQTKQRSNLEKRTIRVIGTGQPHDSSNLEYITSVQHGIYVWHIFEKISINNEQTLE